ncbi:MAG: hypothetical protein R3F19_04355 [Verrucomicrobiales bacterium]
MRKAALIIDLLGRARESAAGTEAKIEQLTAQVEQLEEMLTQRDQRIRQLERENQTLVRRLYGPKSDRPGDEAQLLLDGIIALEHPGRSGRATRRPAAA